MAKSPFLGTYDLENQNEAFTITFEIPENCSSLLTEELAGVYAIAITLNPDEKFPSPIFIIKSEMILCDSSGNLEVGFLLPEEGGLGLAKKPRFSVNT